MPPWLTALLSASTTLAVTALLGMLYVWRSVGLHEAKLHGKGELIDRMGAVELDVRTRDHRARNDMQSVVGELEGRVHRLELSDAKRSTP